MEQFFQALFDRIDGYIVLIVVCSELFQRMYLNFFKFSKFKEQDGVWKTLLLSVVMSCVYVLLARNPDNPINWAKIVISYFAATSLHQIILKRIIDWIRGKAGVETPLEEKKE